MKRLLAAMAAEGERLCAAAVAIGGRVSFDATTALVRDHGRATTCRIVKAGDGWIAVNLARDEDIAAVPAWIGCPLDAEPWAAIAATAQAVPAQALLEQAVLLHLPIAIVEEAAPAESSSLRRGARRGGGRLTVLDLSALWAGPYCSALLAEAGCEVTRIESPSRPDPTPMTTPLLDARINGGKQRVTMELNNPAVLERISRTDIIITSGRPHALARLGLEPDSLFALNPGLIWVAVTGHGWSGGAGMRVGFGDDCAAAGGLVAWHDGRPHLMGDALADPLTGLLAARRAMAAVAAGQAGLIDAALASSAAHFARMIG